MRKMPIRDYSNDGVILDYIVIDESPESRLKSLLDSSSKSIMLSTVHLGTEKHFLFPAIKTERLAPDSLYLTVRNVAELPMTGIKAVFLYIGLVALSGGVKKLIWRERCVLQNTNREVQMDIPLLTRMDAIGEVTIERDF